MLDVPDTLSRSPFDGAVVVWANHIQFGPDETASNRRVETRSFIWANTGRGWITSGGRAYEVSPSHFVFLPWRHDSLYRSDAKDPFRVNSIHIIPWHDPEVSVELRIGQRGMQEDLLGVPYRRDADWPGLAGMIYRAVEPGSRLLGIVRLTVDHFENGKPDELTLRGLAAVLLNELVSELSQPALDDASTPPQLKRMQDYIGGRYDRRLTIKQIAAVAAVSESTAERLFRQYTGRTVGQWLTAKRMSAARDLLRTTNRSVAQVARAVGFDDPSYFSRLFRRAHGVPPRTYTARSRLT